MIDVASISSQGQLLNLLLSNIAATCWSLSNHCRDLDSCTVPGQNWPEGERGSHVANMYKNGKRGEIAPGTLHNEQDCCNWKHPATALLVIRAMSEDRAPSKCDDSAEIPFRNECPPISNKPSLSFQCTCYITIKGISKEKVGLVDLSSCCKGPTLETHRLLWPA